MINYSLYLYSNLLKLYDKNFANLEYDLQYSLLPTLYKAFEESEYNTEELSEYDGMINWLENQYKK